jgi:16S rRNA (cytosine1402-N4)-methyltransferase
MLAHDSVPVWPHWANGGLAGARGAARDGIFSLWSNGLSDKQTNRVHVPVLLDEAMAALNVEAGGRYVDATFGAGGYSRAILNAHETTGVLALDRDPEAVRAGAGLVAAAVGRLTLAHGCFGDIAEIAREFGFEEVDGVVFDIGVSSMQLDEAARGFSFRHDGPLDMRMSLQGPSAADIVNSQIAEALADILRIFGEERFARRVARAIVAARRQDPIRTTKQLQRIIAGAVPDPHDGLDPATRSFQALRIVVNDELGELVRGLSGAASLLRPGGRLVVVTFHSLEDRIAKLFLQGRTMRAEPLSRHLPAVGRPALAFRRTDGPITATPAEIARNSRARSAKLRFGQRGEGPLPSDLSALLELATLPERGPTRRHRR